MRISRLLMVAAVAIMFQGCVANISIKTNPPGADAKLTEIGGDKIIKLGQTPVKRNDVSANGQYNLSIDKPGFVPYKKTIDVGHAGSIEVDLTPVYEISIDTEPQGARASIEDRGSTYIYSLGKTPATYTIEGKGPFVLNLEMNGYESVSVPLETTPGKVQVLKSVTMRRKASALGSIGTASDTMIATPVHNIDVNIQ